jgi:mono/diheme cytochrome c family protein
MGKGYGSNRLIQGGRKGRGSGYRAGLFKWTMLAVALVVQQPLAENSGERIAHKGAEQPGAVACAFCHGEDGSGNEQAGLPRLAGLDAAYIETSCMPSTVAAERIRLWRE